MNIKFVLRGVLLAVPLVLLISGGWTFLQTPFARLPEPTPLPPTILVPRGTMPTGKVGLQEWAQYQGNGYRPVGSGFLFSLANGDIVAATTAHSVIFGDPDRPLQRIALGIVGQASFVGEFDTLRGEPGRPLTPDNLTVDYLLLEIRQEVPLTHVIKPDPRGAPQAGERVVLFSGLGDGLGNQRLLTGTVQSVDDTAAWVLMDDWFNPGHMSGSPFVSEHTGQAVGMAVAASPRWNRLLLGMHPIGSLVQIAGSATSTTRLVALSQEIE